MDELRNRAEAALTQCPEWFHSIELAPGIVTPGRKSVDQMNLELKTLSLPDLHGKTVLDIGAYDGFFSFAADRMGAERVTALDHYVWSTDMAAYMKDWNESRRLGTELPPPHESRHWQPETLPGRLPFDSARALLGSKVEPVVGDFMTMDLSTLGRFDVVLFLGVLYHLEEPLTALRKLASVTAPGGLAVIETEAMEIPGLEDRPLCEFFPGKELNNDPSNWWSPNAKALEGLCKAAGFREVTFTSDPLWRGLTDRMTGALKHLLSESHLTKRLGISGATELPVMRYRATVHAQL